VRKERATKMMAVPSQNGIPNMGRRLGVCLWEVMALVGAAGGCGG